MSTDHQLLHDLYGLAFPESFFAFNEFVDSVSRRIVDDVLGVRLEGPFLLLEHQGHSQLPNPLWEGRYYHDPPEFLTVLSGHTDGLHWGYYIDDPNDPLFPVASYYSHDACELSVDGDTIFEALRTELEKTHESHVEYLGFYPADKDAYESRIAQLGVMRAALQRYETGDRPETGADYLHKYQAGTGRNVVAQTRDLMGIVVPRTMYKPLEEVDSSQHWHHAPDGSQVQQLSDQALQALADGYPGGALKLGKDLWLYSTYQETSYALLDAAYANLGRDWLRHQLEVAKEYRAYCDRDRKPSD